MTQPLTALQLVDLLIPEHDRTSCNDTTLANGFFSRDELGHGRCTRCMWLEMARGEPVPDGLNPHMNLFEVIG